MKDDALAKMDAAHAAIVDAFRAMPDSALGWLKPGDDYAIGGIVIHLLSSLDGYIGTLAAMGAADYRDTQGPAEDDAIVDAQLAHARRGLAPTEREATFAELKTKHLSLADLARRAGDAQFDALVGITYPGDDVPYPTSVALVVQWMTEHYAEHVPQAQALFAEWQKAR